MEIRKLGTPESRWSFEFQWQWLQAVQRCNWYTFTIFRWEVENEAYLGTYNWHFGILGFLWYGSYTYNPEPLARMTAEMDEWLKKNNIDKE